MSLQAVLCFKSQAEIQDITYQVIFSFEAIWCFLSIQNLMCLKLAINSQQKSSWIWLWATKWIINLVHWWFKQYLLRNRNAQHSYTPVYLLIWDISDRKLTAYINHFLVDNYWAMWMADQLCIHIISSQKTRARKLKKKKEKKEKQDQNIYSSRRTAP